MSQIPLHPDRALDPHLCYCPRCGGESNSLTIGHLKKALISRTPDGKPVSGEKQYVYANRGKTTQTAREMEKKGWTIGMWEEVEEHEKVPGDICDDCCSELAEWDQIIKNGGIYWRCKSCEKQGVIKPSAPICKAVREEAGIEKPDPIGIEFDTCVQHGEE